MNVVATLVRHSFRRVRPFLIAVYVLLFFFQLFIILAARSMEKSGLFKVQGIMPEFIARWTNMAAMSFRGLVLFGYSHPAVLLFLMSLAIFIGSEPAGEIESKFVDLMMSRPVPRTAMIHRSLVVLLATILGAITCMVTGTWAGLRMLAPPGVEVPAPTMVLSLAANLALVTSAWGAITMGVAAFMKRRSTATAVCGIGAFCMFVLDYVGRFWSEVRVLSRISPFHYFNPFEMIGGLSLSLLDVGVLSGIILAGWITACVAYARRDL